MSADQREPLLAPSIPPYYSSINPSESGPGDHVYQPLPPPSGYQDTANDGDEKIDVLSELKIKLYKRRWYILIIYSLFAGTQGGVWNTWGPISASCEEAFGWDNADISLLTNWGPISYIVSAIFFSWLIDVKGLRWACLSSMVLVAVGCGLRCITSQPPAVTWLVHIGQFLNGLGGLVAMGGPPAISAVWFAPHERMTATAFGQILNSAGVGVSFIIGWSSWLNHVGQFLNGLAGPVAMAGPPVVSSVWFGPHERATSTAIAYSITLALTALSFILGPLLVPDRGNHNCTAGNLTLHSEGVDMSFYEFDGSQSNCSNASIDGRVAAERKDIMFLMYIEAGWAVLILLAMLIYFPKKPPLPPCITASIQRENFSQGLKNLFKKGQFWLVCFVYGLAIGVLNCWAGVLDVDLKPHGISQNEAGWIGFYATCAGCFASLAMARFADIFSKHMKWIVLVLYSMGGGFFVWFTLICYGTAPSSVAVLYLTVIGGMTFLNASTPLLYELSCELTYPIGEGITNGVLTLINNIGGLVFLLVLMIPNIGTMWMNWTLVGSVGVCVPVLLLLKDTYKRLELDETDPKVLQS